MYNAKWSGVFPIRTRDKARVATCLNHTSAQLVLPFLSDSRYSLTPLGGPGPAEVTTSALSEVGDRRDTDVAGPRPYPLPCEAWLAMDANVPTAQNTLCRRHYSRRLGRR